MKTTNKQPVSRKNKTTRKRFVSENYCQAMTSEERNQERKRIFEMAEAFLEFADRAYCSDDYALNETFLFMYRMLWEYARDSLSPRDYLDFCKTQLTAWQELYM